MYYVYVDEAGTSAREPVTVVAGVMIDADRHWRDAAKFLQEVLDDYVPKPLRPDFVFHAKDVWSGYRAYDDVWTREARANLIGAVASIPRFLATAVSVGKVRRDWDLPGIPDRPEDFHHMMAFWCCVARANKYIRDWTAAGEVATLVAEDVPNKRKLLKNTLKIRDIPFSLDAENLILTQRDREAGRVIQTLAGDIDRIVDTVHFVEKDEAPLLQLADACAFSLRRYLAGQNYGEQLVLAMCGEPLIWDEWQGPWSQSTFSFNPTHLYPRGG